MTINSTKKIVITTAAAALTTGVVAMTDAHADTVNNAQTNQTQPANQISNLKSAQDQSRQNYSDAKSANDQAKINLQNAEIANSSAQSNLTNAQNANSNAQQAFSDATQKQSNAQNAYNQALSDASKAGYATASDIQKANQDVTNAKSANEDAQSNLVDATYKQAEAQQNANNANSILSNAQKNADTANTNVKKAQDAVNDAQTNVDHVGNLEKDIKNAQKSVDEAQAQKNMADSNVTNTQKDVNVKQSNVNAAQSDLNNAQSALKQVTENAPVVNHIAVNQTYIDQMRNARGNQMLFDSTKGLNYNALVKACQELHKTNKYQYDPDADAIAVKFNANGTLSHDDVVYITQYAARLLNEIRSQIGTPLYKISTGSIAIAEDVANQYTADNWDAWTKSHDMKALGKVSDDWGTLVSESWASAIFATKESSNYDFDTNTWNEIHTGVTRNDLQREVYSGIVNMLFDDKSSSFGHTTDILGTRYPSDYNNPNQSGKTADGIYYTDYGDIYLGVDYSYYKGLINYSGINLNNIGGFHFNAERDPDSEYDKIVNAHVKNNSTKYLEPQYRQSIDIPTVSDHATAIKSAQEAVTNAQIKLEAAKSALTTAQSALTSAKSAQSTANNSLTEAQHNLDNTKNALAKANKLQDILNSAKISLANAQNEAKQADSTLTQAKSNQAAAQGALTAANDALVSAKTKASETTATLKTAQTHLNALTKGQVAVSEAQDALNAANEALQVAKFKADAAASKLESAQAAAKNAQETLITAQTNADAKAQALTQAKNALISDAKVYGDSVAVKPIEVHAGDTVPVPELANPTKDDPTQSKVMSAYLQLATSNLDAVPTGTKLAWANFGKVTTDAKTAGNYSEDVLVTFPDSSTTTIKGQLTVLVAEPSQPEQPSNSTDTTGTVTTNHGSEVTTLPAGKTVANSHVVNADGSIDNNYVVINGHVYVAANNTVSATAPVAGAMPMTREAYKTQSKNSTLPQTGNHSSLAAMILGLAGMFGLLGVDTLRRRN